MLNRFAGNGCYFERSADALQCVFTRQSRPVLNCLPSYRPAALSFVSSNEMENCIAYWVPKQRWEEPPLMVDDLCFFCHLSDLQLLLFRELTPLKVLSAGRINECCVLFSNDT